MQDLLHDDKHPSDAAWHTVLRVPATCPVCAQACYGAEGRAVCFECNLDFPIRHKSRKTIFEQFLLRYYMSKNSQFYHRAGCKYLRAIDSNNLIETTEPRGRPCKCISR